ncbi:hypothetical protein TNIN_318661 [Trichonephila inaurata madagascariensis]|uniref:Uncharacterized protein n=1 Tax=Trichonephila inaurata madagascariensis TaxID=2747483 RepID=A0A8X7C6L6_9ARAC|nr:hypothetical protein TNIN_318661 [Trichonephila inaurata madagascariensis]
MERRVLRRRMARRKWPAVSFRSAMLPESCTGSMYGDEENQCTLSIPIAPANGSPTECCASAGRSARSMWMLRGVRTTMTHSWLASYIVFL